MDHQRCIHDDHKMIPEARNDEMMEDAKKPFTAASLHVPEGIAFGQEVRPT